MRNQIRKTFNAQRFDDDIRYIPNFPFEKFKENINEVISQENKHIIDEFYESHFNGNNFYVLSKIVNNDYNKINDYDNDDAQEEINYDENERFKPSFIFHFYHDGYFKYKKNIDRST